MVEVSIKWLLENCPKIYAFGGQVTEDNLKEYFKTDQRVQTTLTMKGKNNIEYGNTDGKKFVAVLPKIGLADCFPVS